VLRPWFLIGFAGFMEALCAGVRAAFACHLLSAVKAAKMVFTARRIKEEALMGAIGQVTKQIDGSYKGNLRTISIKAGIEIVPNAGKDPLEGKEDCRTIESSPTTRWKSAQAGIAPAKTQASAMSA
jgi:hypothetical protein